MLGAELLRRRRAIASSYDRVVVRSCRRALPPLFDRVTGPPPLHLAYAHLFPPQYPELLPNSAKSAEFCQNRDNRHPNPTLPRALVNSATKLTIYTPFSRFLLSFLTQRLDLTTQFMYFAIHYRRLYSLRDRSHRRAHARRGEVKKKRGSVNENHFCEVWAAICSTSLSSRPVAMAYLIVARTASKLGLQHGSSTVDRISVHRS